jgi:hypothetical protein
VSVNAAADVAARLRVLADRAARPAPVAAATAAGRAGETLVKLVLTKNTHAAGTPTPSPKGSPPAKISGDLARSVQRTPTIALGVGVAETTYGPTVIYGTVQEFGMPISVKRKQVLANAATGQIFGTHVVIPPRPFMRPSTVELIESGELARVMTEAFLAALDD